jgi:hypothetical protein
LNGILSQSSVYFEPEIPSVKLVGFGYPAASPKSRGPWTFGATSFRPPLSSAPSRYQCCLDPILGHCQPIIRYWLEQTALLPLCHEESHQWFSTASTRFDLTKGKLWPPLQRRKVWYRICHVPLWRDQRTLSTFLLATATTPWYLVTKMYYYSPFGWSGNQ